jgi:rare lipoprotein A
MPLSTIRLPVLTAALAFSALSPARAAAPAITMAADSLSAGAQQGASHELISLDNPSAPILTQSAALPAAEAGFDPADIDPAVAHPGRIWQTGVASWYGARWSGRRTASGARFNPEAMTAASATLPIGARVLVTLQGTARSVLVTITDRIGTAHRVIDLSRAAARKIGILARGTARVILQRV